MNKIKMVLVNGLTIHASHSKMYYANPNQIMILSASIKEAGKVLVPITITSEGIVVSGVLRVLACIELGIEEIPAIISDDVNDESIEISMVHHNTQRVKSAGEIINEIKALKEKWAKPSGERTDLIEGLSEFEKLTTNQKISKVLNISESNIYKIEKIAEQDSNLLSLIDSKEISVGAAYKILLSKRNENTEPNKEKEVEKIYIHECPNCNHKY